MEFLRSNSSRNSHKFFEALNILYFSGKFLLIFSRSIYLKKNFLSLNLD